MNISKLIILANFLLTTGLLSGQTIETKKTERIVVVVEDQAVVASLDTTGAIAQVIMPIPDYFNEDFEDAHYIAQSFLKNPIKSTKLNKTIADTLAKIETTEPSQKILN